MAMKTKGINQYDLHFYHRNTLYAGEWEENLITPEDIYNTFFKFGHILKVRLQPTFAMILFEERSAALRAAEEKLIIIKNQPIPCGMFLPDPDFSS